ncbi:MAG: hypothetical protein DI534_03480 [Leifsonia xyli]|nr:MAG: hypothetical protein DI534_03480 [Leifsonia xyli]
MTVLAGILLLTGAFFNVATWPTFLKRVARDTRARDAAGRATRFLRVHQVLVAIAMVLAAASATVGVWVLVAG